MTSTELLRSILLRVESSQVASCQCASCLASRRLSKDINEHLAQGREGEPAPAVMPDPVRLVEEPDGRLVWEDAAGTIPQLPPGCGYEGSDFGAAYPDSKCYGGRLYDLDNCDDSGNLYEPADFLPCPKCQHEAWRETFREQIEVQGYEAAEKSEPRESCQFPDAAKLYPQDGQWLKDCWLKGYAEFKCEDQKPTDLTPEQANK